MSDLSTRYPELIFGIGSRENRIKDLHLSYERALTTYHLKTKGLNFNSYRDLGIYQLLTDTNHKEIYPSFVTDTLGPLIDYDIENNTNYLSILSCFFKNDCHLSRTADSLFFHKNTLKYKMNKIRKILDYDILTNENRTKNMIALSIYSLGENYYKED